jgi:hypothetical protein
LVLNKSAGYDPVPLADDTFQTCPNGAIETIYLHRGKGTAMTAPGVLKFSVSGQPYFKLSGTNGCDLPQAAGSTCSAQVDFFPIGTTGRFEGQITIDDSATGMSVTMRLHANSVTCP